MTTAIYHYDLEQRSNEWHEIRKGRFTGTDAALLLVKGKDKTGLGSGIQTAIYQKAAELIADYTPQQFDTAAMIQGREREPEAVAMYEEIIFPESVTACGFIELLDVFGYSPDGLVGNDGLIEIKCPQSPEYVRYLMTNEIDKSHFAQMQWGLWITGRSWCDYIVFNPDFGGYPISIKRIFRDNEVMERFSWAASTVRFEIMNILSEYENLSA